MDDAKPHVLVVDDESEIRHMVGLCLEKSGYVISSAPDTAIAFAQLEKQPCDAIITDVMMPGEDGISFLARVHERWPEIPVIIMTGYAQLQMAVNAIKNGAFDFVHKPFDFGYLRKIVERAVRHSALVHMEKNYRADLERALSKRTEELKSSMLELEYARSAMLKSVTEKNDFLATISHEMRTPMNGVVGALDLLADELTDSTAQGYLAMARESADRMVALVDEMLSFGVSRSKNGVVAHNNLIELHAFFDSVHKRYQPSFSAKGLAFDLSLVAGLPQHVWTDQEHLEKLINIIIENSLKFTHHGGSSIAVSAETSADGEQLLTIAVCDTGIGIPDGMLEKIFEPFVQGDGSFTREYEGVGLGLSIARQIAQILNGTVHAEHGADGGSRFVISLKMITP